MMVSKDEKMLVRLCLSGIFSHHKDSVGIQNRGVVE